MSGSTAGPAFKHVVASVDELRALMGEPSEVALRKDIGRIDEHCRAFIARSPFVLIATSDRHGRCDVSPKGDAPGFVLVAAAVLRPGKGDIRGLQRLCVPRHGTALSRHVEAHGELAPIEYPIVGIDD